MACICEKRGITDVQKSKDFLIATSDTLYNDRLMNSLHQWSAKEQRLILRGDIGQLTRDIGDFHVRADGPLETVGSVVMPVAVGVTKVGNAIAGLFSSEQAEPLAEGGMKYTSRDIRSAGRNLVAAGKNLVTLHPLRAAGNLVKTVFDGVDIVFVDPVLDVGSGVFGHQNRVRHSVGRTLAS